MTDADLDELRELLRPLVRDVESEAFPVITAATLAARREATSR